MTLDDSQPRSLDDVPRGVWLGASNLLGAPQPDTTSPHICGIELETDDHHKGEPVTATYWQRDCMGCWDAGWRPKNWEQAVAAAKQAAVMRHMLEAQVEESSGNIETT